MRLDDRVSQEGWTQGRSVPTIPEATFIAGAAVQQAYQASGVAAQAAAQAEFFQAQAYEAQGAASALHDHMVRREQEYQHAANALRTEAERHVFHARSQAEEIIRPSMSQTIRAEVQGQAEAWATQQVQEQVTNVEMQASAALERQRQCMLEQANAEMNARNLRIASLEEQNARLLEALGRHSPEAHMATMTQLARETLGDVSGLTTPKSTIQRTAPTTEVTQVSFHLQVCPRQVRLETACPTSMKSSRGS